MKARETFATILAIAIVASALWLMEKSTKQEVKNERPTNNTSVTDTKQTTEIIIEKPIIRQEPGLSESRNEGINKCNENGHVTYSNAPCPSTAQTDSVELHDTAGIISPLRKTVTRATAITRDEENQPDTTKTYVIGKNNTQRCDEIKSQIADLDSMARQPQTMHIQDWIRQERSKLASFNC